MPALRMTFSAKESWGTVSRAQSFNIISFRQHVDISFCNTEWPLCETLSLIKTVSAGHKGWLLPGAGMPGAVGDAGAAGQDLTSQVPPHCPSQGAGQVGSWGAAPGVSQLYGARPSQARPWAHGQARLGRARGWAGQGCGELETSTLRRP